MENTVKKPLWKRPALYLLILCTGVCVYGCFWLIRFRILPSALIMMIIAVDILALATAGWCLLYMKKRWIRICGGLLAVILAIGNGMMGYSFGITYNTISRMNDTEKLTGSYVELDVMDSSVIENVKDLEGRTIGVLSTMDPDQKKAMTDWLDSQEIQYELKEYDSSLVMARNLKGAAIDAIIIYQPYLSVVSSYEGLEDFASSLRPLHQIEWEAEPLAKSDQVDVTKDPFIVLVSGIDTYGQISATGRSDVNMLICVNPTTHSILLLSIPRDYYVPFVCNEAPGCPADQNDKLTHSGIFGIDVTEKTLEKLFDTTINYDVRVNFSSVIDIIDALGGIDVNNVDTFDIEGYHFDPGIIHMDGNMALHFSRERYSFAAGDRERGRNQMRVVQGIIDKALSPAILENYSGILNAVADSVQMNISTEDIAKLVSMQLSNPESWNIYTYSVSGGDAHDFAPALGDVAYVMIPDELQVKNARMDIQAILNGEPPAFVSKLN